MAKEIDPFDFDDVSDLPEELRKGVTARKGRASGGYAAWVDVLQKGKAAGYDSLTLAQLKGAAHRMGLKLPSDQTLRKHLDDAQKAGAVTKPTKQTYSVTE